MKSVSLLYRNEGNKMKQGKKTITSLLVIALLFGICDGNVMAQEKTTEKQATSVFKQVTNVDDKNLEAPQGYHLQKRRAEMSRQANSSAINEVNQTYTVSKTIKAVLVNDTLTFSGSGAIPDYNNSSTPWNNYNYNIKKIIINKGITSIGQQAFRNLINLESVSLPTGLTTIQDAAFYECYNLASVSGGASLKTIGEGVFADCFDLTQFSFPAGLQVIKGFAFQDTGLGSINLPSSLKTCEENAFMRAGTAFNVATDNPYLSSKDGALFDKAKTKLLIYPAKKAAASYALPTTLKSIANSAFIDATNLTAVSIPSSVKTLGDWVFARSGIKTLTLPSSITSLGDGVADGCENLTKAVVNASIQTLPYRSFSDCTLLSSVTLSGSIETLYMRDFYNCTSLTSITLPSGLKEINGYAFYGCTNLKTVKFPSTMECIEAGAFENCPSLESWMPSYLTYLEDGSYVKIESFKIKGTSMYKEAAKVLTLVNKERAKLGKKALIMNTNLFEATQLRAAETAVKFDHTRPSMASCFTVSSLASGENIAAGDATASSVMESWMESPGHRSNILSSEFQSIGIGCFYHNGVHYWVQLFSTTKGTEKTSYAADALRTFSIQARLNSVNYTINTTNKNLKTGTSTMLEIGGKNDGWDAVSFKVEPSSIKWSTDAKSIASVSNGKVTGVNAGRTRVHAICPNGKQFNFNITVTPVSYKITYYLNGGTQTGNPSTYQNTSNTFTLKNPTRKGYTFKGWYSDSSYKNRITTIQKGSKGNKSVYAKWSKNTYKLSYYLNGGKNGKNQTSYTVTSNTITLKSPTRKGYSFKGWYSDSKYKNKVTSIKKGSTGNKALYAKWAKVSVGKGKTPTLKNSAKGKLSIKYGKVSGVKGYQIVYSTSSKFTKSTTKSIYTTATSKTVSKMKKKTYYVKVRAYKSDSTGSKVYGSYSVTKKLKINK